MKQRSKAPLFLRTSLMVLAVSLGLGVPETLQAQPAAAVQTPGNPELGHVAYTQYCSICHGVGAQGFIGPRIAGVNFGNAGLQAIVRHGAGGYGGMPPFSRDSVSDRSLDDVLAYLVSLGPPAAAPATAAAPAARAGGSSAAIAVANSPAPPGGGGAAGDAAHGSTLFAANCASCHGAGGKGGFGPALKNEKSRKDFAAAVTFIKNPAPPMPKLYPAPLSEQDVRDVTAYVENL